MTGPDPLEYSFWLASRSAGVVAIIALSASVIFGLMMANNLPKKPGAKKKMLALHEASALVGLVMIAAHAFLLLGDKWLHPNLVEILVPFTMSYRPVGVAMGIVGGWIAAILGLSFYLRKYIGNKRWRNVHRLVIFAWILSMGHIVVAGSDAGQPWMIALLAALTLPVLFLFLRRVFPNFKNPGNIVPVTPGKLGKGDAVPVPLRPPEQAPRFD